MEMKTRVSHISAFTLIELLVVIGLIAVLAGVIGLSLGRGNSGVALQAAQGTLQGLVSSARAQAAIKQQTADLVVDVNPASDGFLRTFYLVVNNEAIGAGVTLPSGIYIVPKTTATTYSGGVAFEPATSDWASYVSSAFDDSTATVTNLTGGPFSKVMGIKTRGTASPSGGNLVLASAERSDPDTIVFNNPNAVRGAVVSTYGVLTLINDSASF